LGSSLVVSVAVVTSETGKVAMDSISMIPESANGLSGFSSQFRSQIDANTDGLDYDGCADFYVSTSYSLSTDPAG